MGEGRPYDEVAEGICSGNAEEVVALREEREAMAYSSVYDVEEGEGGGGGEREEICKDKETEDEVCDGEAEEVESCSVA